MRSACTIPPWRFAALAALTLASACSTEGGGEGPIRARQLAPAPDAAADAVPDASPPDAGPPVFAPAPAQLSRLTRLQYHNAVRDLFGPDIAPPSSLEPDAQVDGLRAIGASVTSLSPRGVEQAYEGAKSLAAQLMETPERRQANLPCAPAAPDDAACLGRVAREVGARVWRRPLADDEVAPIVEAATQAGATLASADAALSAVLVQLLASPHFLYRVELGEADPQAGAGSGLRYTSTEMASRLAFALWNTVPDEELRAAGARGDLVDDAALAVQVQRMVQHPRFREGVRNLFAEWLDLYALDDLSKDPNIFRHFSADLGASAREETLRLVDALFVDADEDFRQLLLSRTTFVDRRLAAIYNVPAVLDEGFGRIELPADGARAGYLGQVAFLALYAHPTQSSATKRGIAIRRRLLCEDVPSPPANLNTAIPEPSTTARTLKERLEDHQQNPACSGCHTFIDPPGYGLENFDGIGRFRVTDNGAPIDPSGYIDDYTFTGPTELFQTVSDHPDLLPCAVRTIYAYATGHKPLPTEQPELDRLAGLFETDGHRIRGLLAAVVMSPGFRRLAPSTPESEAP